MVSNPHDAVEMAVEAGPLGLLERGRLAVSRRADRSLDRRESDRR